METVLVAKGSKIPITLRELTVDLHISGCLSSTLAHFLHFLTFSQHA